MTGASLAGDSRPGTRAPAGDGSGSGRTSLPRSEGYIDGLHRPEQLHKMRENLHTLHRHLTGEGAIDHGVARPGRSAALKGARGSVLAAAVDLTSPPALPYKPRDFARRSLKRLASKSPVFARRSSGLKANAIQRRRTREADRSEERRVGKEGRYR